MQRVAVIAALVLGACSFTRPGASGDDGDDDGTTTDGDGIGATDNCPSVPNKNQDDADGDKVGDACDNCAAVENPRVETMGAGLVQRDHDADGQGDACDLCPHLASAARDADPDGDAIGSPCDPDPDVRNPAP